MGDFEFASAWVFWLAPLPLLVYFLVPRAKKEQAAVRVPFFASVRAIYQQEGFGEAGSHIVKTVVLVLIWFFVLAAAARPQWVGESINLPSSGRDLMLAVDISESMRERDMLIEGQYIERIAVVKYVAGDFVKRRKGDRLGLVLFGSEAYLFTPLTFDLHTVNTLMQETQVGFAGGKTAIGDAIGLAIKRLRNRPASQRVLILLTDGANTAGELAPRQAADLAAQEGIKIYTVGVGADEILQRDFFGNVRKMNPSADLDEDTLKYIADTTGGAYFRARNPEELVQIYTYLDEIEPIDQEEETFRPIHSLFYWPLALALFLSFVFALPNSLQRLSNKVTGL